MTDSLAEEALVQFLYRVPIGLIQTSLDGTIVMINPMSAQLLMPLAPDGNLENLFEVLQPVVPQLRDLAAAGGLPGDLICDALMVQMPRQGSRVALQTLALYVMRLDGSTLMACVSDATVTVQREAQRLETRLHGEKRVDALTSLPNRVAVLEWIGRALGRLQDEPGYHFALLLVNADRFERINVTAGQSTGDAVLRLLGGRVAAVAQALGYSMGRASATGASSALAARLGADEFAVCLEGAHSHDSAAGEAAQRLISALQKPYVVGDQTLHLGASVGLVTSTGSFQDTEAVLQHAGLAMREAKRNGGAQHAMFLPGMMDRAKKRGDMEHGLRIALAERQLFAAYQPIVDLSGGAVAGMEALVRWRHPERGMIMPTEFIAVAEATGLICELGDWMLNETCRQLVSWQALLGKRAPQTISVNLSRAQLGDSKIVERVANALRVSGLQAACLQLEVTESLAAQDLNVRDRLNELKELGLTLALDDFGTGYSSLASLHELPVDVIKIDRSFVIPIRTSAHHRVLIEAVVRVAQSLSMRTVAEGIETEGEAALLTALGCTKGQGYFYSRPLAEKEATDWLQSYRVAPVAPP